MSILYEIINWLPFPPGSQKITEIIKKRYDKPYKKFGDVPLLTKKLWFKEWKSHFLVDEDDEEFFWKAFKYRTSKRFSQMMSDIHEGVDTIHEWLIPAYKKKKQLDRTPTHEEVFKETHTLKSDKSKWVDKRSQDTHEKFIKKLAEVQAQHVEAQAQGIELPPIDEDLIWEEVCGGQKKNRVYRKGAFFSSSIKSKTTSANSTDEHISKLLDTRLAPLEKTQKKLEKLERAIGKAKKKKLKQKRWNEAYVSYYKKVRASSSSTTAPLPPPLSPPPPSISSDEDYDDDRDEDDTEDYS
ncbi:hypothetical protein Ahy_A01g003210 [Arachis hypogaea]|uniref:Uncharacterized protein n=1 Tax=Arachis hypogaea TaxID=3818 RepID=A0A445ESE4_ARAHY|nr:hypothetical protein Ahy_A01g003210 [Arachis hypogaea]